MLRDQADTTQDALVLENLLIEDLNQESIHRYRILFNNLKPDHIWAKLGDEEFLLKIGAARKSQNDGRIHPTLGGLIFLVILLRLQMNCRIIFLITGNVFWAILAGLIASVPATAPGVAISSTFTFKSSTV